MSRLPETFLIGAATAAHQVEGNNTNSDYWAMEHMRYGGFREPSSDAVDHYRRYREDIRLMADAGLNAYRFSIEWARIEPERGVYDEKEIEHYRDVLECCRENGIEPIVTMHHFTSPKWLIEQGGWDHEEVIHAFADYCAYTVEKLGGLMHYVCTINEANMGLQIAGIAQRYQRQMTARMQAESGTAARGNKENRTEGGVQVGINMEAMLENLKKQQEENLQVFKTAAPRIFVTSRTREEEQVILKAHQAAKAAMKAVCPGLKVGITLSLHDIQAEEGGEEQAAKAWEEEFTHYIPWIQEDDFLGLQNYTRSRYGADGILPAPGEARLTQMEYEYYPQALGHVIRRVHEEIKLPVMVTENGIATADDGSRVSFIQEALAGVEECIHDGIPVLGYLYWSLLDNFEWQKGYSMTFGLIGVDRTTQTRHPKESLMVLGSCAKG